MSETMVAVQEKPILFSGAMVRAILEGKKTQTRRVVKPQPEKKPDGGLWWRCKAVEHMLDIPQPWDAEHYSVPIFEDVCPYGKPGDRLWVREAWASGYQNGCWGTIFRADSVFLQGKRQHPKGPHFHAKEIGPHIRWRPSIHMPRWASRITLEITEIRVQRVKDISRNDEIAEGMTCDHFPEVWEQINGKRGFGWDKNPWVWAITFKRVQG